ncbi:hypothetical protein [Flavivirga spongiicola]|uniref:Uncharacterized protein n=1 Tax=Flavivirga spongiicola TaxID=421621 RepID=A0ABU7XLQ6_9FLAO|nr:hypothetical protein [Flavivirga sp. MEBiC05379]MDO5981361.1 hypothetical protein [Flavivirga sp. MEBiC05379]
MSKRQLIFVIVIVYITTNSFGQKNSFTNTLVHFVIKERNYVSKEYANSVNNENGKRTNDEWEGDLLAFYPPTPSLPKEVPSDFKRFIHFTITPKHYIEYRIVDNIFENDTLHSPATIKIVKLDRKDLTVTEFIPLWFEMRKRKLYKMEICNYNTITEYRKIRKNMCGYDCFKITLEDKFNSDYLIELYVTEDIRLNYHPIVNCEKIFSKYFPLYVKEYKKEYPNDYFREFSFVKSQ